MKYKFFRTILAVMTLIITSCSKDKSPYTPDISLNNVSATISIGNNASFQFSATGAAAKIYPLLANPSSYRIEAIDANNNNLIIVLENVTQTGTYPFTSNNGIGNGLTFVKNGIGLLSELTYWTSDPSITNKGSLTITVLNNHHIEGLFTAFCKNDNNTGEAAQVSNGSFKGNF
jgi:hypothetical protein